MSNDNTKNSSQSDFEALDVEHKSNDLVGWIIAIVITGVAIYAVPLIIGLFI